MLVLDTRPKDNSFDGRLRGYNGAYCYYDELSKWQRTKIHSNLLLIRLLLLLLFSKHI